ncbi:MAG: hypothetical protein IID43_04135 [Planctomycetes bacterium]|nr:hypothetical protein [Planctomycetota bacterium]
MSPGEIAGLAATVALATGIAGAAVTLSLMRCRDRAQRNRERLIDAYAGWLAARLTFSRVCASFVTAIRASLNGPGGANHLLERDEVQRARQHRYEAMRELELAEAMLLAWCPDDAICDKVVRLRGTDAHAMRAAINGDDRNVDQFFLTLCDRDRQAIDLVRSATSKLHWRASPSVFRDILARVVAKLQSIVDHWRDE